ncbi:OB-fold-containig protein [Acinetobacter rathckeae]|uniref:OB-fold-containig protein n=1 Tax=Acinetobacter rathckeae TaxID=2605272 RepID=UPI0018A25F05|nr:OB-fold-containig protein [Acinetobacter rathckeae]MBF7687554.1 DUF1449 family protein [Acinetobacter rathckeae]MBF7694956.1 DUF1449 family protein [Acinetobacter rathckeae]
MGHRFSHFLLSPELLPFHVCVVSLITMSAIETIGFYFGKQPLYFLKPVIPSHLWRSFSSVKFSKVLIVLFFLLNFSFAGYFVQFAYFAYQQSFSTMLYVLPLATVIGTFFTVFMVHCLNQVITPRYRYKAPNLVGRLATISNGEASTHRHAEARVRDEYGQLHYIQVYADFGTIPIRSQIIIVKASNQFYIAKKISDSHHLFDTQHITQ